MKKIILAGLGVAFVFFAWAGRDEAERARRFVHPQARIQNYPEQFRAEFEKRGVLAAAAAVSRAAAIYGKRGIGRLCICEVTWIAGGVSGYLVDARGDLRIAGGRFSIFRLGITDSPQGTGSAGFPEGAGEEFVFIARGVGPDGQTLWLPAPGPDYLPKPGEDFTQGMLAYEYLLDRERFETLADRYSPCPAVPKDDPDSAR